MLPPWAAIAVIRDEELRNNLDELLRRAEAGEELTVTVSGRPVARLGPASPRAWVSGPALARIWQTPAPARLTGDLTAFPGGLADRDASATSG
jgi:prevent-host-death family protein